MSLLKHAPPCWSDSAEPLAEAAIPPLCFGSAPIPAFPLARTANFNWAAHSCSLDLQGVSLLPDGSFYFCFPPLRSNCVSGAALAAEVLRMILAGKSTKSGARRYLALANLQKHHFFCHLVPARDCVGFPSCVGRELCLSQFLVPSTAGHVASQSTELWHGAVADRVTAPGGAKLHPLHQLPLCWHRITLGLALTLQLHGPPVLILPEFALACSVA